MSDRWTPRIVSLLPSATEIVYRLGLAERLVGVTHECDYPPDARTKPSLTASTIAHGDAASIDRHVRESLHQGSSLYALDAAMLERLQPDLIITQELCDVCAVSYGIVARAARELRRTGGAAEPRVVSLEPASFEDVLANVVTVAELAGVPERAEAVVADLRERAAAIARAVAGRPRPRTLVIEWTDPPFSAGHWTPGLIELAGGETVLGDAGRPSGTIAWDAIAAADPDVVIVAPCGFDLERTLSAVADLRDVPQWTGLRALREGRAFALDGNAFVARPGPRLVESAQLFARAMHGPGVVPDVAEPGQPPAFAELGR